MQRVPNVGEPPPQCNPPCAEPPATHATTPHERAIRAYMGDDHAELRTQYAALQRSGLSCLEISGVLKIKYRVAKLLAAAGRLAGDIPPDPVRVRIAKTRDAVCILAAQGLRPAAIAEQLGIPFKMACVYYRDANGIPRPKRIYKTTVKRPVSPRPRRSVANSGETLAVQVASLMAAGLGRRKIAAALRAKKTDVKRIMKTLRDDMPKPAPEWLDVRRPLPTTVASVLARSDPHTTGCTHPVFKGACTAARAIGSPYCQEHGKRQYHGAGAYQCVSVAA